MSASFKKQDLPPAGGYAPVNYKRIAAKSFFNGEFIVKNSINKIWCVGWYDGLYMSHF